MVLSSGFNSRPSAPTEGRALPGKGSWGLQLPGDDLSTGAAELPPQGRAVPGTARGRGGDVTEPCAGKA